MSSLSHPSGPEPERVYWVRRGAVAVAVLATVALAGWVLSMLFGSTGTTASAGPAQNDPTLAGDPSASPSPSPSTTSPSPSASGSPTPSGRASIALSTVSSSPASHSASASPSPSAIKPAGPLVCAPSDLGLKVSGDSTVKSGSHTSISVSFTNHGSATCKLDFARTPLTLKIYSGTDRIWTSADCVSWVPSGVKTLAAGKAYTFKEEWPTLRSASGCKLRNGQLQPGTYVATATVPGGQPAQLVISLRA